VDITFAFVILLYHDACAQIVRGSITRNFGSAAIDTAIVSVRDATLSLDGVIFAENDNEDNEVTQGGSGRIVAATRNSILTLTNCQFDSHYTTASSSTQSVGGSIWVGDGSSLWLNHVNASGSHNANGPGGFLAMSGGGVATLDHLRVMDNSATGTKFLLRRIPICVFFSRLSSNFNFICQYAAFNTLKRLFVITTSSPGTCSPLASSSLKIFQ